MDSITYNAGQAIALAKLREFLAGPERFFCLIGPAGSGKTLIVQRFLYEQVMIWKRKVACSAPTNKAVKVIKNMGQRMGYDFAAHVTYATLHQLLGLKLVINQRTGRPEFLPDWKNPPNFDNLDIIVVDEGSMTNTELFEILDRYVEAPAKVVFIGDAYQLPPVGEELSPVFTISDQAELTEIMRHGGGIQKLVNEVRENIENSRTVCVRDDNDGKEGVWNLRRNDWLARMLRDFTSAEFQADSNFVRALAWRNDVVSWGNRTVHEAIYGESAPYFVVGQKLVAQNPVVNEMREIVMATSSECTILSAEKTTSRAYVVWELLVLTEDSNRLEVKTIDPESQEQYASDLEEIRDRALYSKTGWAKKNAWEDYWELLQAYAALDYIYWSTCHKAQGSTFERVYVALGDVRSNKKVKERNQCIYTGLTRAAKQVLVQEY